MKEFMKERGELAVDMGTRRQMGVRIQIGVQEGDDDVQLSFALLKKNTKLAGGGKNKHTYGNDVYLKKDCT